MSLRSFFKNAADGVVRFLENQEITAMKDSILMAKTGRTYVAARGGAVSIDISPEMAQETIERCTQRIAEIEHKRAARNSPQP